jgi:DNA mismatch repair protein MutL
MSDIISLLPEQISNQIAAGEVIQRPASAVKELMENAIDAGATNIKVIIKNAGKTLIQVIDDGKGMSQTDARMCFEKHATSKIKAFDELFTLRTKGFRGEALATIAAVSQVELRTRRPIDDLGSKIEIEDSVVKSQEPCQTPVGTSIAMKNLFFNVPARRNFLKVDASEMRVIVDEFERLAYAHHDIFFSLNHNDTEVYHLPKGNRRQRIVHILGKNYDQKIVPIHEQSEVIEISGYVGKPDFAKKTRGEQFLFVNNRFIKSTYIHHAVMNAYQDLIGKDEFPLYVIFIDIDPNLIDVNVHPTKQEIKFDDDRLAYAFVNSAVRHALAQYNLTPTMDFTLDKEINNLESFIRPQFDRLQRDKIETQNSSSINIGRPQLGESNKPKVDWNELFKTNPIEPSQESMTIAPLWDDAKKIDDYTQEQVSAIPYQLHHRFIISPIKSGYIMIDQQLAHQRIVYETYSQKYDAKGVVSQKLLFPITVTVNASDGMLLNEILEDIRLIGYEIEAFGGNDFVIHAIPADFAEGDEQSTINEFIEQYKEADKIDLLSRKESVLIGLARSKSFKNGKKMDVKEMQSLIDDLFACTNPYKALNGRNIFTKVSWEEIEKRF